MGDSVPWANLDDGFPDHPKIAGLTDSAFRLHVAAICYANRYLTDGKIEAEQVRLLVRRFRPQAVQELVERGLWFNHADLGVYEIRDFLDWNRSRAQVEAEREHLRRVRSEAGKKGARARWGRG